MSPNKRRMERLFDDLLWLYEQDFLEGADREEVSHLRFLIAEQLDAGVSP